jgi:hypothetical protein
MLTIAIPTYNRNAEVKATLEILKKADAIDQVQVLLVDNCSDLPVKIYLDNERFEVDSNIKIVRNQGNVGLGGNIIQCFLHCKTEWMWLLGDDDKPFSNSITQILKVIQEVQDHVFLVKFNSKAGKFPKENIYEVDSEKSLIQLASNPGYYSNLLYISNSVFRVKNILEETFPMSNAIRTIAPHVVGIFNQVSKGNKIVLVNSFITDHGRVSEGEENWDRIRLITGVLFMADADISESIKKKLIPVLLKNYIGRKKSFAWLALSFYLKDFKYDTDYWRGFFFKSAYILRGLDRFVCLSYGVFLTNKFVRRLGHKYFKNRKPTFPSGNILRN